MKHVKSKKWKFAQRATNSHLLAGDIAWILDQDTDLDIEYYATGSRTGHKFYVATPNGQRFIVTVELDE